MIYTPHPCPARFSNAYAPIRHPSQSSLIPVLNPYSCQGFFIKIIQLILSAAKCSLVLAVPYYPALHEHLLWEISVFRYQIFRHQRWHSYNVFLRKVYRAYNTTLSINALHRGPFVLMQIKIMNSCRLNIVFLNSQNAVRIVFYRWLKSRIKVYFSCSQPPLRKIFWAIAVSLSLVRNRTKHGPYAGNN